MPSIYTHNKFSKDVYNNLKEDITKTFSTHNIYYEIFSQSFDNLFYYNIFSLFKGKNIRAVGKLGHRVNVNLYFNNILNYITKNNLKDNSYLLAYLYGSVNHYILDSVMHPYIFYKTGAFSKKNPKTYKYNGLHTEMEFMIDAFLYEEKTNKSFKDYNITKNLIPKLIFPNELIKCIDEVYFKTFNVNNFGKIYNKSYLHERHIFSHVLQSKYGIKKLIYNTYDYIKPKSMRNIKYNHTNIKYINPNIFNLKKLNWNHPCDKNVIYNYSFFELYDIAIEKSTEIIYAIHNYFQKNEDLDKLLKLIGNNSYITGLPIENNKKLRYFEF